MTFETALTARLQTDDEFAAALAEDGGWSLRLVRMPGITLQLVADDRPQHYKGFQRFRASIVQADVWAPTVSLVAPLRDRLIDFLTPAAVVAGVSFRRAAITGVRTASAPEQSGAPQKFRDDVRRASIDFTFLHDA